MNGSPTHWANSRNSVRESPHLIELTRCPCASNLIASHANPAGRLPPYGLVIERGDIRIAGAVQYNRVEAPTIEQSIDLGWSSTVPVKNAGFRAVG